jgi:O-antigen/teichoic acid export membrane protein
MQGVLLARLLGPAGRGDLATVILWPTLFAGIGIFGVNMAIARFAGQDKGRTGLVRTAIMAALLTGGVSALACGLALPALLPVDKHHLLPAAYVFTFFIPLNHLALNLQGIDHGAGNFVWLNVTRAVLYPVYFAGLVLAWLYADDKVLWAISALLVANGGVVLIRLFAKYRDLLSGGKRTSARELLTSSLPFVTANVIALLYMQTDKALLVWLLPPEEIGWYVAAFAAAGSANVLSSSLGIVQFSTAAQSAPGHGFADLARLVRRGALVSLLGAGLLAIFLPWLVPLVYGIDFMAATPIAFILLPGMVLTGLGDIVNQSLRGQGQPVAGVVSKVAGLIVMGLMGFYLATLWGGKGIALGFLAGATVAFVGLLFVAIRYYQDATWQALRPDWDDVVSLSQHLKKKITKAEV